MRAVVQRVARSSVTADGKLLGAVGQGLLVFLGVTHGDTSAEARYLAKKIAQLRIFEDERGKMNLSVVDVGGAALVVSQFTLYADCRRGRRPAFTGAAPPSAAEPLYLDFARALAAEGVQVFTGQFGGHMLVELVNDGPVTIWLDTGELMKRGEKE